MVTLDLVSVAIPIYKEVLTEDERLSLERCQEILGHYPVTLFAPDNMDVDLYVQVMPNAIIKRFAPNYFQDIDGYNRLMLSSLFYDAFRNYDYILIYQLDAFVFSDNLHEWCEKGYDYVGAPWIEHDWADYQAKYSDPVRRLLTHHIQPRLPGPWCNILENRVGNGGLSLRKIRTFRRCARDLAFFANKYKDNEDQFWSFFVPSYNPSYRVAPLKEALQFSFDTSPSVAFDLAGHKIPFGCHAWRKYDIDFWRPIFLQYGHVI